MWACAHGHREGNRKAPSEVQESKRETEDVSPDGFGEKRSGSRAQHGDFML